MPRAYSKRKPPPIVLDEAWEARARERAEYFKENSWKGRKATPESRLRQSINNSRTARRKMKVSLAPVEWQAD